ncbi:MAG: putative DNA-binding domain-containing protein [Pseudomonadota bacterium]
MASRNNFQALQRSFTDHIRDPENVSAPDGVEARRMGIYRRLFFNSLSSLLTKTFPVTRRLLDDEYWHALIRGFLRDYRSHTPLFLKIPGEFVEYLASQHTTERDNAPWLLELAHYEWQQLALSISEAEDIPDRINPDGDIATQPLALSALALVLGYRFPVHRLSPTQQPDSPSPEPHFLLLHRNADDRVQHLELNPTSARLLEVIRSALAPLSGVKACGQVAAELGQAKSPTLIDAGLKTLADLRERGIVYVTRCD